MRAGSSWRRLFWNVSCKAGGGLSAAALFPPSKSLNAEEASAASPKEKPAQYPPHTLPLWHGAVDAHGPCRHLLLIRHGQYDESHTDDDKRGLSPVGVQQADMTGRRLAAMSAAVNGVPISRIHVSDMRRARETADAIARQLPADVVCTPPDPDLNEGTPTQPVPDYGVVASIEQVQKDGPRAEKAFHRYFHCGCWTTGDPEKAHECEVIVGHANFIRYFVCRALRLPPDAWLSFHMFNCSLTYLLVWPDGCVQIRTLGDVGHLPEDLITFSGRLGWNWYGKPTKCLSGTSAVQDVDAKDAA